MHQRRESFAETDDIRFVVQRQNFPIPPKIRLTILQRFLCQRPRNGLQVVANQQRLAALSAEIVQASCLVAQTTRAVFKMSNVHCFWPFLAKLAGPNMITSRRALRQVERESGGDGTASGSVGSDSAGQLSRR